MSSSSFLPDREAELAVWTAAFSAGISQNPEDLGLSQAMATEFAALNTAWIAAFNACNNDATNTTSACVTKRDCKALVISKARELARIIQACPTVTNTQRSDLGLNVPDPVVTPTPVPVIRPTPVVVKVVENTVTLRLLEDPTSTRRGRPYQVAGASIYSFTGPNPVAGMEGWVHQGNASRMQFEITMDPALPAGTIVNFRAFYFNSKFQSGPCGPIATASLNGVVLSQSA